MLSATRKLIADRNIHSDKSAELVSVRLMGSGTFDDEGLLPNTSYDLAFDLNQQDPKQLVVAGWLVLPFDRISKITYIIHHWWNMNIDTEEHIDITFKRAVGDDYVFDKNLTYNIYQRIRYHLTKPVCSSLILKNDRYTAIDLSDDGNILERPITALNFNQLCPSIADATIMPFRSDW